MLELFPTAVLDTSILTSVLVGLLVVWLLQEWLGWGLTALVVPGYLASVLVIQPATAAVIVFEAIASWLFMVALSDALPRWWPWFPLFGRDRFFLALLGSVAVRLAMEGGLFPLLASRFDLHMAAELHSMGLVVVPLLAYAIWRNGPVRAIPRLGVPLLLTWLILDQLLLRHSNLSLSSFELTYEDLALDFVSSPRAYILLLTGAWLGSVTNLRYGWDFGGIIVPGLLALCWLQPERLAATVGEAMVIAIVLQVVLRVPALSSLNLAGGRLLVLGVVSGYLLKFAMGHVLGSGWPGLRLRQLFGFGYLLPTLMALRIVRSGDPFRTLVPSVLTSLGGFGGGTALAYLLAVALPSATLDAAPDAPEGVDAVAALQAAWDNQGPMPADLEARLDSGRPAVLQGGKGFGALWLRGEGRPVLVTTRTAAPGQAEATLAVAAALDARAVLLCAPSGPACGEARRRLGFRLPLLVVDSAEQTRLQLSERVEEVLDAKRPGTPDPIAALQANVGSLDRSPAEGEATLSLSDTDRFTLAASWRPTEPAPWEHPAWRPLQSAADPDAGTLALLRASLAGPLVRWARGEPGGDNALRLAASTAELLGARLSTDGKRVSVVAPDWRLLVRRGGSPVVVDLPFADDAPGMVPTALSLARALDAVAWAADAPPRARNMEHRTTRPGHALLVGLLEGLGEDARVLSIEHLRDLQDPGGEAVLSAGRPVTGRQPLPRFAAEWRDRLDALGVPVVVYDGDARRVAFRDGAHPGRAAARAATGGESQATLFVGSKLRQRTWPLDSAHPLHDALVARSLPVWQVDVRALADHAAALPDGWQPWADAARATTVSGSGRDLARLQARARRHGARLGLACDPVVGCRWLLALRCRSNGRGASDVARCSGALASLSPPIVGDLSAGGALPADGAADASAPILDRLLLGAPILALDGLAEPGPLEHVEPSP